MITWLRSALFNLLFYLITGLLVVGAMPLLLLPRAVQRAVVRGWAGLVIFLARLVCGIRLRVTGAEHLPRKGAALIAAKHQSALDTIVWLRLVPDAAYVLKRELLWIPVWGWHARKAGMIAVDRSAGATAMRHLIRAGKEAVAAGRQIVIFPEGTRVAPGGQVPYQPGVVALAGTLGLPVIPVATDSGRCWGRRAFRKQPGVVTVAVLPPLPAKLPRGALLPRLEAAIEAESARLLAETPVENSVDRFSGRL